MRLLRRVAPPWGTQQLHTAHLPPKAPSQLAASSPQRPDSGRLRPSASQEGLLEHSSGHLHRVNLSSRQGSGGSQGPHHPARPAQSLGRHMDAGLSSVSLRQRAGAPPGEGGPARQPWSHPQPHLRSGGHHSSWTPRAQSHFHEQSRIEPSQVTLAQHQSGQHSVQPWPGPLPLPVVQHSPPLHGRPISLHSGSDGGGLSQHGPSPPAPAYPMHKDQQPDLAAGSNPPAVSSSPWCMQQQEGHAGGPSPPVVLHSETDLPPNTPAAPIFEVQDAQPAVQQFEAWYGGLSNSAQGMQHQNHIKRVSASGQDIDRGRGLPGSQSSQQQAATDSSPPATCQKGQVPAAAARLSKKEAAAVVKPLLNPLYAQELLVHHQFSDACRRAVHLLREGSAHSARAAVKTALSSMGLELAASRVC